ncbi:6-bladed beta-propeller [Capnocytophaga canis]|uniref:6-bladed beta-propeller n=1 Tax=Capnocytophaga canis TaxID=1848903 RepID=UPI0037D1380B
MKTTQILIGMVMLLIACSDSKKQSNQGTKSASSLEKIIDLEKAIENPIEPLNLSDFVEDIEYIRPEYPTSLVDIILDVSINDNHLFLHLLKNRLLCYSRDGKFLREIGKYGQGPKEHLGIRAMAVRDSLIGINSNWMQKILWYNLEGNYLGETPISDNVFRFKVLDKDRIVINPHHGIPIEDPNLFITGIINSKGDTILLKKSKPYYSKGFSTDLHIWQYNDMIRMSTYVNDTIYSVSKDTVIPTYVIDYGKYKANQRAFADSSIWEKEQHRFIKDLSFCEMNKKMLLKFVYNQKKWYGVYDKQTGKTSVWSVKPDSINKYGILKGGGWINDVDGGFSPTFFRSASNDYFIADVQPNELKAQFSENKRKIKVKHPEKQRKLEQLINSLDDDENPVIVVYKLKK